MRRSAAAGFIRFQSSGRLYGSAPAQPSGRTLVGFLWL